MAISFTYDELVAELQDYLEDEFDDFANQAPVLIELGERRLLDDLDLDIFDQTNTSASTSNGSDTLSRPTDMPVIRTVKVNGQQLEERSWEWVDDYNADASNGQPLYWAENTDTAIKLAPTPDASYSSEIRGVVYPEGLTASNSNSFLGDNFGDALLYACLVEAERYVGAEQAQVWQNAYLNEKLPNARNMTRRMTRDDYRPLAAQPRATPEPRNRQGA